MWCPPAAQVSAGSTTAAELLISCGAEVGRPNHMGLTPMLLAAVCGHSEMVQLLGRRPGNGVNMVERMYGRSPLAFASRFGDLPTVRALLAVLGIMTAAPEKNHSTPLWAACRHGHTAVVAALLENKGAKQVIDSEGPQGLTPLQAAAVAGEAVVVQQLLHGGKLTTGAAVTPLPDGEQLLSLAIGKGDEAVVRE
eukprot:SAG22_NODE_2941_length_2088_cov_1.171443_3_plen_194_part_01